MSEQPKTPHEAIRGDSVDSDDELSEASAQILERLTPPGGFGNKWQRQRARRRAKHTGGHDANYK